jgi:N-methylhydantoinase B
MRIRGYRLRTGDEGAGAHRGGFGLVRDIEVTHPCVVSTCIDRSKIPPFGLFGGDDGSLNRMFVKRAGEAEWQPLSSRQSNYALQAGDCLRVETAIGGGYGDPLDRDPALVAEDVSEEYLTAEQAGRVYGVVTGPDGSVDEAATRARREELRASRGDSVRPRTEHPERAPQFTPDGIRV